MSNREEYIEKLNAKLKQWDARIEKLEADARSAKASAKIELNDKLDDLRNRRDGARERLEQMRAANAAAFEELKKGFEQFWDHAKRAFDTSKSGLS